MDSNTSDRVHNQPCDLIIIVGEARFKVHRAVMENASNYIRDILADTTESEIYLYLYGLNSDAFQVVLEYLYGAKIDFSRYQIFPEMLLEANNIANKLGVNDFSWECEAYFSRLMDFNVEFYTSVKIFGYLDVRDRMKALLFRHLVPERYGAPPAVLNSPGLTLTPGKIPYDLMFDTLELFKTPEITLDYGLRRPRYVKELGSLQLVTYRVNAIMLWIEAHLEERLEKHLSLLDCVGLEDIPPHIARKWIRKLIELGKPSISNILQTKFDQIRDAILDLKIRVTWLRVYRNSVEVADLLTEKKMWSRHRFEFRCHVKRFAVDQNLIYFVTSEDCLFYYDVEKEPTSHGTFIMPLPQMFYILNAFADNHILYLYGTDVITYNIIVITYHEETNTITEYDLGLNTIHYHFPAMFVQEGKVYFKYQGGLNEVNLDSRLRRKVISLPVTNTELDEEPHLAKSGNSIYAFDNNGRYFKDVVRSNPITANREILSVDKSDTQYAYASACSIDEELYVGLCPTTRPGPVKLFRGSESEDFQCLGYVPDPMFDSFMFEESVSLVLRKNYGPLDNLSHLAHSEIQDMNI